MEIVTDIAGIHAQQLFHGKAQPLFPEFQVVDHDQQLHAPGDQGGDGRALNAQLRTAQIAVNQQVIQGDIDAQRGKGDHIAGLHDADGPQGRHQDAGHGENDVGKADDLKIPHSLGNDPGLIGQQAQQLSRRQQDKHEHHHRQGSAEPQGRADDMGDGLQLIFAQILGAQHHGALTGALHQHLQQELHLVAQADAAHGVLAVPAQHDGIHHIDAVSQQIL